MVARCVAIDGSGTARRQLALALAYSDVLEVVFDLASDVGSGGVGETESILFSAWACVVEKTFAFECVCVRVSEWKGEK